MLGFWYGLHINYLNSGQRSYRIILKSTQSLFYCIAYFLLYSRILEGFTNKEPGIISLRFTFYGFKRCTFELNLIYIWKTSMVPVDAEIMLMVQLPNSKFLMCTLTMLNHQTAKTRLLK